MGKAFAPPMCLDASRLTCSDEASSNSNSLADARIVPLAMVSRAARSTNTPPVFCRDARPWLHGRRWCVLGSEGCPGRGPPRKTNPEGLAAGKDSRFHAPCPGVEKPLLDCAENTYLNAKAELQSNRSRQSPRRF